MDVKDSDGESKTYGCACVAFDAVVCIRTRYGMNGWEDVDEQCACLCHEWRKNEDDE